MNLAAAVGSIRGEYMVDVDALVRFVEARGEQFVVYKRGQCGAGAVRNRRRAEAVHRHSRGLVMLVTSGGIA